MAVEKSFMGGETAAMELLFADEASIAIELPVTDEAPAESTNFELDSLTISNPWMRPVTVEGMDEMEMSSDAMEATPTTEGASS